MKTSSTLIATLVLAIPLAGMALNPQALPPGEHALNLPGATTMDAPPAGFDPISASDQQLQDYRLPPRPDQNADPNGYATWVRAMKASKTRVVPQLEQTTIFHSSPNEEQTSDGITGQRKVSIPAPHDNNLVTSAMAGYVFQNPSSPFYLVETDFTVPIAQQQIGACSGGWQYASAWAGLDGFGSPDVLQAGVEFDAYCSGTTHSSYYALWYEWYPYGEVRISGIPVAPGDDLFVEIWHTTPTQGYVYVVNFDNNQSIQLGLTAYPGYPLKGNSAEWIVEDTSSAISFIFVPFWDAYAYTQAGVQDCSANGTAVVSVGPPALSPTPMGSCAFVVH